MLNNPIRKNNQIIKLINYSIIGLPTTINLLSWWNLGVLIFYTNENYIGTTFYYGNLRRNIIRLDYSFEMAINKDPNDQKWLNQVTL